MTRASQMDSQTLGRTPGKTSNTEEVLLGVRHKTDDKDKNSMYIVDTRYFIASLYFYSCIILYSMFFRRFKHKKLRRFQKLSFVFQKRSQKFCTHRHHLFEIFLRA